MRVARLAARFAPRTPRGMRAPALDAADAPHARRLDLEADARGRSRRPRPRSSCASSTPAAASSSERGAQRLRSGADRAPRCCRGDDCPPHRRWLRWSDEHRYAVLASLRGHGAPSAAPRSSSQRGEGASVWDADGQPLLRRHREPVVRQRRPRPPRRSPTPPRARWRAGQLLGLRRVREPARDHARRAPRRLRRGRRRRPADLLRARRRRRDRHRGQARAALLRRHRQPERVHLIGRTQGYHGTHGLGTAIGGIPANRRAWVRSTRTRATSRTTRSRRSRRRSRASARSASRRSSSSP